LAWKYAETKSEITYQNMENAVQALHSAIKGTPDKPVITRFADADGTPFPAAPSKDVYTSFFFGYGAAYPYVKNEALKRQMRTDVERIANRFLIDELTVRVGDRTLVTLSPYLRPEEIRSGIHELFRDKRDMKNFLRDIKIAQRLILFGDLWHGFNEVLKALKKQDEERLFDLVLPSINGMFTLLERGRDILTEKYRDDLFPRRRNDKNYPGKKLAGLITQALERFPKSKDGVRFTSFRISASWRATPSSPCTSSARRK